jgi:hypothetical protein
MPLTPHTIRYEDRRVQCVGCRLCGVYFCACAKRNAPLHPRTPVPTAKLTQRLHKHRGPCTPYNAEPVRDGGGRESPLHGAYYTSPGMVWYGVLRAHRGESIEANIFFVHKRRGATVTTIQHTRKSIHTSEHTKGCVVRVCS